MYLLISDLSLFRSGKNVYRGGRLTFQKVYCMLVMFSVLATLSLNAAIINVPADYATVQGAINAAAAGDTIRLDNASSPFTEGIITIPVAKNNLTIEGQGSTIISTSINFGIDINADNAIIKDLTITGAGTFGFITGAPATGGDGLQLINCTALNNGGTGFAITGVMDVTMTNTQSDSNGGNGLSLTSVQNVTITDFASKGNTFGMFGAGIGIFSCDSYMPCGSNNITINGVIDILENPMIYSQENACGATCGAGSISNVTLIPSNISYTHFVGITQGTKFYYTSLADAHTAADLALDSDPSLRPFLFVEEVSSGNKFITPKNIAASNLSIQAAHDFSTAGDTLCIADGDYSEGSQIIIDKNFIIKGGGKLTTILRPGFDTGNGGDARAWFLVNPGNIFGMSQLTLDGTRNLVFHAVRHKGSGDFNQVLFTEIKYNESGPDYSGVAIAAFGDGNVNVTNSMFTEIGRIGVLYFGTGINGSIFYGNMYTGKGIGDWLDYALDISAGAFVKVDSNIIQDNVGVASSDGSNSAGILVTTFFGMGTKAYIHRNSLLDNYAGIFVGFDAADASTVEARNNDIVGNRFGVISTNPTVDALLNWWGHASGPDDVGPGTGDSISINVLYCPWLTSPMDGSRAPLEPVVITCPPHRTIECGEDTRPLYQGMPTATGPLNIEFESKDTVVAGINPKEVYIIYRRWIATNTCGVKDTCIQIITVVDEKAPRFIDCPQDTLIDVSQNSSCDTTLYFEAPSARDLCNYHNFTGFFDPIFWMLSFNGIAAGNDGTADISSMKDTLVMTGTSNGIPGLVTSTDFCVHIDSSGTIGFDWLAEATGGQILNDEPAVFINGTQFILSNTMNSQASGIASYPVTANTDLCFRVRSDNLTAFTQFTITSLWFAPELTIKQVKGPKSDSAPRAGDGDRIGAGRYEVVFHATDAMGNSSTCSFNLLLSGTDNPSCKDINVSLDENCGVKVVPGMVLTGIYNCLESFLVEVFDHGVSLGDSIGFEYLGYNLDYTLTDPGSGNSCWGTILVEDKFRPEVLCKNDTMTCSEFQFKVDTPDVIEHCQKVEIFLIDERITEDDCGLEYVKFITRRWLAIDESGNVSDTCDQKIWIERFPIGDVKGPVMDTSIYCGSGYDELLDGNPSPTATGVPTLNGVPLWPTIDFFCNITTTFKDFSLGKVQCKEKILRQWQVTEWWCKEDSTRRFGQFIYIIDTIGPDLEIGFDTIVAHAGKRSCDALVDLPVAVKNDACHSVIRVDMVYPGGFAGSQNGGLIRLPIGIDTVVYRAYDSCYNMSTDTLIVKVSDGVAPIAICDGNTTVNLNRPIVNVLAETFDDGSFDECGLAMMEVRRMSDPCGTGTDIWGLSVDFCCNDIGQDVMVAFRVTDESGNSNTCMVRVQVQDKIAPRVVGLPNIRVECQFDWDMDHLDIFGKFVFDPADRDSIKIDADSVVFIGDPIDGLIIDNCPPVITEEVDSTSLNNCGTGHIVRLFTFTDPSGNEATWAQTIFFDNLNKFDSSQIIWPDHIDTSNVCGVDNFRPELLPVHQGFPRFVDEDECSLVGYDYEDEIIDASLGAEACFKIIRNWIVIDWCQDGGGVHKKWYYTQVIEVNNTIPPVIKSECKDTMRCVFNATCVPDTFVLLATATDDCTDSLDLYWTYKIDLMNDGDFDTVGHSNDATGLYPIGIHRIKWLVEDLCGNLDTCEYIFELRNCKPPSAYCMVGMIVELTPIDTSGNDTFDIEEAIINAKDLDVASGHVCGHPVILSFSSDITDTTRVYTCDSLIPPKRDVTIWVTDTITGKTSKCLTFVEVQDNNNVDVCGGTTVLGTVSGLMSITGGKKVDDVEVYLENSGGRMQMSDLNGMYSFNDLRIGYRYEVMPSKDDNPTNGVSTADLVVIQRHLLGRKIFDSPYKYIAADVNNSGTVSAADIAELRKLILGIYPDFPRNTSWRFVDSEYRFLNPFDPWEETFPESHSIDPFENDMSIDFEAIKIGDLTGDVEVGNLNGGNVSRSNVIVDIRNKTFKEGQEIEVTLRVSELEELSGWQYTLEWDKNLLELVELVPNFGIEMSLSNFGLNRTDQGMITCSWHTTSVHRLPSDKQKVIGVMKFKAKSDGDLMGRIHMTSGITKNEVYYRGSSDFSEFALLIGKEEDAGYFTLYQNVPNPWNQSTIVAFHLPEADAVNLIFFDENGRTIRVIEERFDKGHNKVEISKDDFGTGVYYYRLETKNHVSTRKMVIIR